MAVDRRTIPCLGDRVLYLEVWKDRRNTKKLLFAEDRI